MRFAIRRRIGSGGTVRLQWLFRTNSVVGRTEEQVRSHINLPAASYEAAYWVERNLSSYDEVVRDVIYLRSGASFEREAEAPAALHLVVPPDGLGHRTRAATKHNVLPQSTTSDFARRA